MSKKQLENDDKTLESRLKQLEGILEQLRKGDVTIDEASKLYHEGMLLVKECRRELRDVRGNVAKLDRETGTIEQFEAEG